MKNREHGVALVEFAFVLPLLLLLSLACTELGRAVYRYNSTAKVVRNAVRYLSMQTPGTHVTEARNLVLYGNVAGTGPLLDPALVASKVPAPTWQTAGSNPLINTVTIRVSGYQFQPMIGSMFGTQFSTIPFNDISATMRGPL